MGVASTLEKPRRCVTEDEFLRLPNDGKYELVEGEVKRVPAGQIHDFIGGNVIAMLHPAAKGLGIITSSQAGYRMRNGNIRCPDAAFVRKERLPGGRPSIGFAEGAPDLAVEIISPSEERTEIQNKLWEYFDSGAQRVWHLFPETETLRDFTAPDDFTDLAPDDEITGGDLLPRLHCRVRDFFALE